MDGDNINMETQIKDLKLSAVEIKENMTSSLERASLYRRYGYDRDKSNEYIIRKAGAMNGSVLEIGTGKGNLMVLLAKKTDKVITVDVSKEDQRSAILNAASENVLDKIKFVTCNGEKLPYPDNSFNVVISSNAFHHFEHPFAVISEMMRVCRKKLIIADFNSNGLKKIREIHRSEGRKHEEKCGDLSIIGTYLKEHGFKVKEDENSCQKIYFAKKDRRR